MELKPALEFLSRQDFYQAEITNHYQPEHNDGVLIGMSEQLKRIQKICSDDRQLHDSLPKVQLQIKIQQSEERMEKLKRLLGVFKRLT